VKNNIKDNCKKDFTLEGVLIKKESLTSLDSSRFNFCYKGINLLLRQTQSPDASINNLNTVYSGDSHATTPKLHATSYYETSP
jgi:hypothetical protein